MDKFEYVSNCSNNTVIRVIGVGGGGGSAVEHMAMNKIEGIEFFCVNTDSQALESSSVGTVLQLGSNLTKGLGAGADPEIGRQAALEDHEEIKALLEGADMVFIAAGMGGGTGTGAAPVIAQSARDLGILTVAVVTKPFLFEGKRRMTIAEKGIVELSEQVDSLITIPNQKLMKVLGEQITVKNAFAAADDVLLGAVRGIAEIITQSGKMNVDFADVRTVMSEKGRAMMGSGVGSGENRAQDAAEAAIHCPLLEDINLKGARGILVNIAAGVELGLSELTAVGDAVSKLASENAQFVTGIILDESIEDEVRVTVVATGLSQPEQCVEPRVPLANPDMVANKAALNYRDLDVPTVARAQREQMNPASEFNPTFNGDGNGYDLDTSSNLDVPAFLRRGRAQHTDT